MKTIAEAVAPLKKAATEAAAGKMLAKLMEMKTEFEENGWDLNKVAPSPDSFRGYDSRKDYMVKKAKHDFYRYMTNEVTPSHRRKDGEGNIRTWDATHATSCMERARRDAGDAYLAYVSKLEAKVGDCVDAEMTYSAGVWSNSVLTVTKADGKVEDWNTKTIINVSVLGKLFNQWPTRLMV